MKPPIKLISTDFDGTLHTDFENPPVPVVLESLIGALQQRGVVWVINTGRDLTSLMESLPVPKWTGGASQQRIAAIATRLASHDEPEAGQWKQLLVELNTLVESEFFV